MNTKYQLTSSLTNGGHQKSLMHAA